MAKRKLPARGPDGRFIKSSKQARKKKAPKKRAPKKAAPKKRTKKPAFKSPPSVDLRYKVAGHDEAKHAMRSVLQQAQLALRLGGIDSRVYAHTNRDGSIDAEIKVPRPEGMEVPQMWVALQDSLPRSFPGIWLSSGTRFAAETDHENYTRFKGLEVARTYYQRYTPDKSALNILGGRKITGSVEKRQDVETDHIYVRFYWHQSDTRPDRPNKPYEKKLKKRKKRR